MKIFQQTRLVFFCEMHIPVTEHQSCEPGRNARELFQLHVASTQTATKLSIEIAALPTRENHSSEKQVPRQRSKKTVKTVHYNVVRLIFSLEGEL